jgi:hypothetical protein
MFHMRYQPVSASRSARLRHVLPTEVRFPTPCGRRCLQSLHRIAGAEHLVTGLLATGRHGRSQAQVARPGREEGDEEGADHDHGGHLKRDREARRQRLVGDRSRQAVPTSP